MHALACDRHPRGLCCYARLPSWPTPMCESVALMIEVNANARLRGRRSCTLSHGQRRCPEGGHQPLIAELPSYQPSPTINRSTSVEGGVNQFNSKFHLQLQMSVLVMQLLKVRDLTLIRVLLYLHLLIPIISWEKQRMKQLLGDNIFVSY
ncbi:hypothetical protein V2J09_023038 [Rumex salicifolius]